jgi:ABC-type uncharacterized transport system, auxiliary component
VPVKDAEDKGRRVSRFHERASGVPARSQVAPTELRRTIVAIAALTMLAACSTSSIFDSDTPVPANYVLAAAPSAEARGAPLPVDISISRPDMGTGLDTDRIAVLKGRELDYYKRVRWGSRATELVQFLVVDSLENQKIFRSVTAEQARVAGDYVLDLQVRDFQSEYASDASDPTIRVTLVGRLIRVVDRKLVATVQAQATERARANRMSAVAAAFESAAHRAILDLGTQVASAIAADRAEARSD